MSTRPGGGGGRARAVFRVTVECSRPCTWSTAVPRPTSWQCSWPGCTAVTKTSCRFRTAITACPASYKGSRRCPRPGTATCRPAISFITRCARTCSKGSGAGKTAGTRRRKRSGLANADGVVATRPTCTTNSSKTCSRIRCPAARWPGFSPNPFRSAALCDIYVEGTRCARGDEIAFFLRPAHRVITIGNMFPVEP